MSKKVLIVGGTGFLGKSLAKKLIAKNYKVRLLHRKTSNTSGLPKAIEKIEGDVLDYDSLLRALEGVDYIFHSAALVKQWIRDRSLFDRINLGGFENSMKAAEKSKIKKIIYTSSFMALGPSGEEPSTEQDLVHRKKFHNHYERTKYLAEIMTDKFIDDGLPIVKIYPGVIYGPGDITEGNIVVRNFLLPRLNKEFLGFFMLGKGEGLWSYSYIEDVVDGHIAALEKGKIGEGYILGGENANHKQLFALLQNETSEKPPPLKMPFLVAKSRGYLDLFMAKLINKEPEVTPGAVSIFQKNWAYDSTKAIKELDYKITPLKEGIKKTVTWLRENGYYKK